MPSPFLLAIETSQRQGGVAVQGSSGDIRTESLQHGGRHADDLIPAIDRLMASAGRTLTDLAAVAVSIGPGGFTGLRIGITTARMIAEVRGVGVIPIPTAAVVAESIDRPGPILVALASKRESCWVTRFERGGNDHWLIAGTPGPVSEATLDLMGVRLLVGDEHLPSGILARCDQTGVPVLPPTFDPAACLLVALRMWSRDPGVAVDPVAVMPLYAREPEAVALWRGRGTGE